MEDWVAFCESKLDFDKSHFLTLFHNEYETEVLSTIFSFFPSSSELMRRMMNFQSVKRLRKTKSLVEVPKEKLLQLAAIDLKDKTVIFEELGESDLEYLSLQNEAVITSKRAFFDIAAQKSWPNGEKQVVIGDYVLDHWIVHDKKAFALFEALYGAANSYDIQYYLAAPLIDTNVNFDHYFELWSAGADVALTEENILVYRDQSLCLAS